MPEEKTILNAWAVKSSRGDLTLPTFNHTEEICWDSFVRSWSDRRYNDIERLAALGEALKAEGYRTVPVRIEEMAR